MNSFYFYEVIRIPLLFLIFNLFFWIDLATRLSVFSDFCRGIVLLVFLFSWMPTFIFALTSLVFFRLLWVLSARLLSNILNWKIIDLRPFSLFTMFSAKFPLSTAFTTVKWNVLFFLSLINMPANLENSAVATGLEKVSFHSNPKEGQCQRVFKLPHNCTHLTCKQGSLQNPSSQASTVPEPKTSNRSSWI